ncbi:hypothetical protein AHMF7605_03025 [Adhaeribacter arboris]|uniref:Outer membrane protein beta-barrel domain-containing protein n=1 Tax=Adhaeribacter arboris TaxID=2072846 RepID=A0A2T2YAN3_9BACT|nr:hypothetical protein [Adhaeribacter arboris]PSR52569.1 hypothetical protein AHMF7605_03025 [Adhaeribacter arboris]
MKNRANLLIPFFCLVFVSPTALWAQDVEIPSSELIIKQTKNQKLLTKIGLNIGAGTSDMKLNQLNKRLADMNIGWLDPTLSIVNTSIYAEIKKVIGISIDFGVGISQDGKLNRLNSYLSFTTFSFGPSIYVPLYRSNRIFLWATGGVRSVDMTLKYNAIRNNAVNFNSLLSNPGANSNSFHVTSGLNQNAQFGGRFQFRLEKGYQEKSPDFRLGLDAGYAYCYRFYPWHETGSNAPIVNMPEVKPDNFYFNLNFSGYF